ncbi:hypothetical protein ACVWW4_006627 [Bradyrhizobium sp. LB7.1]
MRSGRFSEACDDPAAQLPNELGKAYDVTAEPTGNESERERLLDVDLRDPDVLFGASAHDIENAVDVVLADRESGQSWLSRKAGFEFFEHAMLEVEILGFDLDDLPCFGLIQTELRHLKRQAPPQAHYAGRDSRCGGLNVHSEEVGTLVDHKVLPQAVGCLDGDVGAETRCRRCEHRIDFIHQPQPSISQRNVVIVRVATDEVVGGDVGPLEISLAERFVRQSHDVLGNADLAREVDPADYRFGAGDVRRPMQGIEKAQRDERVCGVFGMEVAEQLDGFVKSADIDQDARMRACDRVRVPKVGG